MIVIPLLLFALRLFSVVFCVKKAELKNRKPACWAVFALFFPIITMIIIYSVGNVTTWHTNE